MKLHDIMAALFWASAGILLSAWSAIYKIGTAGKPGPGLFPLLLGLLMILLSLILLFQAAKARSRNQAAPLFKGKRLDKVLATLLVMILTTFLFEPLGYLITIFLFIFFLAKIAELHGWARAAGIAFFTVLGVYLVFVLLLKQPLPTGLIRI